MASADADFAAVLSGTVAWLQLMPRASPACPTACRLVTAADYQASRGFPASSRSAFLALTGAVQLPVICALRAVRCPCILHIIASDSLLHPNCPGSHSPCNRFKVHPILRTGKPEAGVRSLGVGTTAARKLACKYHTVGAILEAAKRNEFAGWGANVQRVLSVSSLATTAKQLQSNAAAVSICRDPGILRPELAAVLQAAVEEASRIETAKPLPPDPVSSPATRDCMAAAAAAAAAARNGSFSQTERARRLAWSSPDARLRWWHVRPHAEALGAQLAAAGIQHAVQHALPNGCTLDVAVFRSCHDATETGTGRSSATPTAVMLRTACDMSPGRANDAPLQLKARLTGRALQHRNLLMRLGWAVLDVDCTGTVDMSSI